MLVLTIAALAACGDSSGTLDQGLAGASGTGGAGGGAGSLGEGAAAQMGSGGDPATSTGAAGAKRDAGSDLAERPPGQQTPDPSSPGPFPPVSNFNQPGPYASLTEANVGPAAAYTVYRPDTLAPDGALNPIVAWTSGGSTHHSGYAMLPHLASHGFVVISSNTVPGIGQEAALGQEMIVGIDWLIEQAAAANSPYSGKLNVERIAVSGYSMGSLASFTVADDPRLTTTLHISGGNMEPERVQNLRQPAAFICGTPGDANCNIASADCDIAGANCARDFDNASTPIFYATFAAGHLGILQSPVSERITAMSTAWLRHKLMDDGTLTNLFVGSDCEYCSDPQWQVQRKQLD